MEPKALLQTNYPILVIFVILFGCSNNNIKEQKNIFEKIDVSLIPNKTLLDNDSLLKLENGVYYYSNKPFSGYLKAIYENKTTKLFASFLNGRQHGPTKTYFPNGKLETDRMYKNGIGYGRHYGYWEKGNIKFDFIYFNDKREGLQKQWYISGKKYYELMFNDDKENGMQKAWRENGKPYINYEVKDGKRYGLQKSALCYTLKDGKLK